MWELRVVCKIAIEKIKMHIQTKGSIEITYTNKEMIGYLVKNGSLFSGVCMRMCMCICVCTFGTHL